MCGFLSIISLFRRPHRCFVLVIIFSILSYILFQVLFLSHHIEYYVSRGRVHHGQREIRDTNDDWFVSDPNIDPVLHFLLHLFLFCSCYSYDCNLSHSYEIEFFNDQLLKIRLQGHDEVIHHCFTPTSVVNFIHVSSVVHNGLHWVGGTAHWFHFAERIIPMLSEAYDKIWGPNSLKSHDPSAIYIVFEEETALTSLGL